MKRLSVWRKNSKEREGKGLSLSLVPRLSKGLFTGYWNGCVSLAMVVRLFIQLLDLFRGEGKEGMPSLCWSFLRLPVAW